jgi:type IX secretion system PorP/SprF family membrane protein
MVSAQQYPQLTQFMFNKYALNPAFGGLEYSLSVTGTYRTQWTEFQGAPRTQMLNAHMPFYYLHGSVGMSMENEQIGAANRTLLTGSYNYVQESSLGLFSIGFRAGVQQVSLDGSEIRTPGGRYQDQVIDHRDPLIQSDRQRGISPVWGLGFFFAGYDMEFGLTFDNVPSNNFSSGDAAYNPSQYATLYLSYEYVFSELISFEPVVLIKSDFSQTQTDIGMLVNYTNLFAGASFRGYNSDSLDALNVIIGGKLNEHLRISYSFDLGLSGLRTFHDGTHEFVVNYNLNKKIRTGELPRVIYNPRYN